MKGSWKGASHEDIFWNDPSFGTFFCFYPEVKVKSGGVVGKVTVGHPVITDSFRHIKSADFFFKNGHYEERPWFAAVEPTFEIPPWKLYWRNERRLLSEE